MSRWVFHGVVAAGASAVVMGGAPAFAQRVVEEAPPPEARIELGVGESDNLNRDAAALRSDMTILGLGFGARRNTRLVRGALAGDVELREYGAEGLADDDEVLGSIDGVLELHVVPDRFRWDAESNFGQVRTDPSAPVGPENRERTTVFSTGPRLSWPFGGRNTLEVGADVAERRFETTETLDSRLTTARLGVARAIGPVTRVALTFERSENEFEIQEERYEFQILSLEYRKQLASGEAVASAGRGAVEIQGESEDTFVARLAWNRAVGTRSRLTLWGARELTDAGGLFASGGTVIGETALSSLAEVTRTTDARLHGVTLSRSPLRRESAGARFEVRGDAATFTVSFNAADDRFETDPTLDNELRVLEVSGSRQFARRWRGEVSAIRWDQDFVVVGTTNEDQAFRLAVSRALARESRFELTLQRNRRVGDFRPFDENVIIASIGRTFGGR